VSGFCVNCVSNSRIYFDFGRNLRIICCGELQLPVSFTGCIVYNREWTLYSTVCMYGAEWQLYLSFTVHSQCALQIMENSCIIYDTVVTSRIIYNKELKLLCIIYNTESRFLVCFKAGSHGYRSKHSKNFKGDFGSSSRSHWNFSRISRCNLYAAMMLNPLCSLQRGFLIPAVVNSVHFESAP
jgi:hypothetical protein